LVYKTLVHAEIGRFWYE